ncbi:MAG TPA: aminodeoxychorismate synthase component I [Acidiferrobacteraceae bacterium]|nr:aminodeoxychorismate synthase component I [Acidiferrobacteraceae bacterium]
MNRSYLLPGAPDLLALHRLCPDRYPYLLETTASSRGERSWDILFAFPGDVLELKRPGALYQNGVRLGHGDFIGALKDWQAREAHAVQIPFPFGGGWFVFLAYEFGSVLEPSVPQHQDERLPLAWAQRCPAAVLRERESGATWYVAEREHPGQEQRLAADLQQAAPLTETVAPVLEIQAEPAEWFMEAVRATQRAIRAGDVFQVNLSRRWTTATTEPAWSLYARLRQANPAPFSGLARIGDVSLLSSSPERLVAVRDGTVEMRPIAGTRPRTLEDVDEDARALLRTNPKERAEHVMLVDLARNDLGRVCRTGSVAVRSFMEVEAYRYVYHLVSDVIGTLPPSVPSAEVMAAVFPGGTITGCPKVRAMQLIRALEPHARGAYTGSMGYLGCQGNLDLNILIRTLLYQAGAVEVRAGAGIVADSEPEREVRETDAKARGMLAALSRASVQPAEGGRGGP